MCLKTLSALAKVSNSFFFIAILLTQLFDELANAQVFFMAKKDSIFFSLKQVSAEKIG